jgi:hypothetical protein
MSNTTINMNKLLFLFPLLPFLFACRNENNEIPLTGKITNSNQNFLLICSPEGNEDTIRVDEEGNFSWSLPAPEDPVSCSLICNKIAMPVYLEKGMDLTLTFDADEIPGSLRFEGKGSDMNNYLSSMAMKEKELNLNDNEILKKDSATFFIWNDGVRETQSKLWEDFKKDKPSDLFWKTQLAEIDFGWANRMESYPSYYKYHTDSTFNVPDEYYDFENGMDINNGGNIHSTEFKMYLSNLMQKAGAGLFIKSQNDSLDTVSYLAPMKAAVTMLSNDTVRDMYLLSYIKVLLSYKDIRDIEKEITFFKDNCKSQMELTEFEKEYQSGLLLQKDQ